MYSIQKQITLMWRNSMIYFWLTACIILILVSTMITHSYINRQVLSFSPNTYSSLGGKCSKQRERGNEKGFSHASLLPLFLLFKCLLASYLLSLKSHSASCLVFSVKQDGYPKIHVAMTGQNQRTCYKVFRVATLKVSLLSVPEKALQRNNS